MSYLRSLRKKVKNYSRDGKLSTNKKNLSSTQLTLMVNPWDGLSSDRNSTKLSFRFNWQTVKENPDWFQTYPRSILILWVNRILKSGTIISKLSTNLLIMNLMLLSKSWWRKLKKPKKAIMAVMKIWRIGWFTLKGGQKKRFKHWFRRNASPF